MQATTVITKQQVQRICEQWDVESFLHEFNPNKINYEQVAYICAKCLWYHFSRETEDKIFKFMANESIFYTANNELRKINP